MKRIQTFALAGLLSAISFSGMAETISVTDSTLDSAESKIAAKAQEAQKTYKIIYAHVNNKVHMTAVLGDE
ncbi:DUF1471 domain-containing protein [Salmonella enterica]|nr:DUF1471 domain-containing protein [Salmonella enterica subsp. enterica serovar Newport]EKT1275006.1 DUF1471 domain-containing protein [Salmonella enterica]EGM3723023.1 DUF1471 domain-containing protein [Salmonella enterica subsp. enterica serovar Newport]EKT1784161.1 DUF1471 domain-containing protein [Salmonella enterica]EKT2131356.1 DUF1471 domain-containing protein [Salmonella enterica]